MSMVAARRSEMRRDEHVEGTEKGCEPQAGHNAEALVPRERNELGRIDMRLLVLDRGGRERCCGGSVPADTVRARR